MFDVNKDPAASMENVGLTHEATSDKKDELLCLEKSESTQFQSFEGIHSYFLLLTIKKYHYKKSKKYLKLLIFLLNLTSTKVYG